MVKIPLFYPFISSLGVYTVENINKVKVLIFHNIMTIGGVETVLVNYLNMMAKNPNYVVHLILFFEGENNFNIGKISPTVKIEFLLTNIETQFHQYSYWASKNPNFSERDRNYFASWYNYIQEERFSRLIRKVEQENYDIIIDFIGSSFAFIAPENLSKIKTPIIYWNHSELYFSRWFKAEYKSHFESISAIVSICHDMEKKSKRLLSELGLNIRSYMLYNPIDISQIIELKDEILDSDRHLLAVPFILQVARIDGAPKNHLKMIEIFAQLKQKGIHEKLYIIGSGNSNSYRMLQEKICELNLQDCCLLLGARDNPFPFMRRAKLFIHTSNYEGLPTVFIESMVCGVPVVAFDCPTGPREILSDGKYGELIPMGNDALFVQKTYELLTNEEKRQHYISLLPEAVERFSFNSVEQQLLRLITEVKNKK